MNGDERRTVIVTGAASGIGLAISLGLVADGMLVAMMDLSADRVQSAVERANRLPGGGEALALVGDITSENDAERAVAQTRATFGGIDALVNNAGIGRGSIRSDFLRNPIRFWEMTTAQWRRFLDVNATGFFVMTNAALPFLRQQNHGRIVTVTTSLDTMIVGGATGYGSAKAAVEATMAILAHDLAGSGVTANVLVPGGPVNTPMFADDGSLPRDAFIQPEVMLPPLRWLLSAAADGVSGQRFIAAWWNATIDPSEAARASGAPTAWPQLGAPVIMPARGIDGAST